MGNDHSHHADGHELHKHPDLAVREAHLQAIMKTLQDTGMKDGDYHAGYTSYHPKHHAKALDGAGKGGGFSIA